MAPQVTVHHVWKQGACFVCTDYTEVFVACEHWLDSHSWNLMQLLRRSEAPSSILVLATCAAQPDRTDNTDTASYKSGACLTIGHAAHHTQRSEDVLRAVQWAWLLVKYLTGLPGGLQELGRWTGSPVH